MNFKKNLKQSNGAAHNSLLKIGEGQAIKASYCLFLAEVEKVSVGNRRRLQRFLQKSRGVPIPQTNRKKTLDVSIHSLFRILLGAGSVAIF